MSDVHEPIRRISQMMDDKDSRQQYVRTGIVTAIRKADRKVRVMLLPEEVSTNWIRVLQLNSGDGYASGVLPEIDSEVVLLFDKGQRDGAFILNGSFAQNGDALPGITSDHAITIWSKDGAKITLDSTGITIDAGTTPVNVKGSQFIWNEGVRPVAFLGAAVTTGTGPGTITSGEATFLV